MKVQVLLFDGFDELDAIAPWEVWQNAVRLGASVQVEFVTLEGAREVVAANGLQIQATGKLDIESLDLLVIPGGGWINRAPQGTLAEIQRGAIPQAIAQCHQRGTTIAAVCTGTLLVAAAGLLQGRPAITHHQAIAELKTMGAEIIPARVVDDGDIVTAGGITSGLDLTLWLIERFFQPQMAQRVEAVMEYERRGVVWRRSISPPASP